MIRDKGRSKGKVLLCTYSTYIPGWPYISANAFTSSPVLVSTWNSAQDRMRGRPHISLKHLWDDFCETAFQTCSNFSIDKTFAYLPEHVIHRQCMVSAPLDVECWQIQWETMEVGKQILSQLGCDQTFSANILSLRKPCWLHWWKFPFCKYIIISIHFRKQLRRIIIDGSRLTGQ